ncbi:MAG TPA: amino acid adenylation domain-containing protein, partial [Longimicrobiaceae bacterium]
WAEVLGTGSVGVHDDFFALGGHSLLGTRVVSRVRGAFGVELPLRALFEAPTVAQLAARVEELLSAGGEAAPPIVRTPRGGPLPLSFAQRRLWFIHQLEPGSATYNMPHALRLRGRFDPAVLERGLTEVVRRHEALRTVFGMVDDEPVQVVREAAPVVLPVTDLRGLSAESRGAEMLRLASEEAVLPFDLTAGPLLRVSAVRLDEADWGLLLTMHHVVSDGWSAGVLIREVSELYDALAEGREAELPELPVQYADFAVWQRAWLTSEMLDARVGYWREKLADAPPLLELPTDRPRPRVQDPRGASVRVDLPPGVARELRALSRREGATAFMTLLAAWQLLLSRYAGVEDVSVGTPVAGRTRLETEPLIGFFVNTLVLRTELSGDRSFRELLGRVRETTLGAYQHQEIPFERLVEELAPERSLARTPLFQVMFVLQNNERGELRMGGLEVEPLSTGAEVAKYDLTLDLAEDGQGISGSIVYRAELWERATMERMSAHFARLVGSLVADSDRPVAGIALITEEERAQLLAEWGATGHGYPAAACIHDLFTAQARRTPGAVAVVHRGEALTYAELDLASNQLAHALRRRGVGPESRVGVYLRRTPAAVAALLGVLKAGGAYVPLDPELPAERIAFMLRDAGVRVVLTQEALCDRISGEPDVLVLDAEAAGVSQEPEEAPETGVVPDNLAYLIFTSGSSGRPKGVAIQHAGAVVLLHFMREIVPAAEWTSVLGATSFSFDVSVAEVFGTLCWGGKLVLVENALELPTVADQEVRLVVMVPTAAAELLRGGSIPRSVRGFNLAGEALTPELAQALYGLGHVEAVRNLYGPTEDTTYSTWSVVPRGSDSVRIGRPVAGSQSYVLDGELQPQPIGLPGELYLAGEGLARGYAGRSELTAERFLPNPFGEPGSRMYRVMDRARWLPDGELEYLGRTDHQVKVRGFRIELGEIEVVLIRHPRVREAVVSVHESETGDRRLLAHVVPEGAAAPSAAELRAHLRERLPEYMVPGAFVMLERLPLNTSGKIDRRALPAPEPDAGGAYVAPRTATEEVLSGIWTEVLRVERVGVHDGFFDRGGHSLLAMQVVSRAREALGVELPLRMLFEAATVSGLAERIESLRRAGTPVPPPIERVSREGALPLSFAQRRLWIVDHLEPDSAAYNMPAALRLRGEVDLAALRAGLDGLVRRHEALRTTFAEHDGAPVQVVHPAAPVALPIVDLGGLPDAEREAEAGRLAGAEALRPFDLARGPLLRSTLLRLREGDHVVCFTLHHVVSDGWSMGVLVREVSAFYAAARRGSPAELPELPVQYADYAVWQRDWLRGEVPEGQVDFWREQLRGAPPLLEIPTDRPRAAGQSARAAGHTFVLAPELARELRALGRREGATLFMALLTGWQALLGRYTGQADVVVGSPTAGRTHTVLEGLIGFFVNMLALRVELDGAPTWREMLGRVREASLGAFAHQEVPFERLVDELAPERSLVHSPIFQVTFALDRPTGQDALPSLDGVALEPFAVSERVAQFDLDLTVVDRGEALEATLLYRAALFDPATAERMARHLETLLEAMVADPRRRLGEASLLRGADRARVLEDGRGEARPFPDDQLVHELIAARAAAWPDAPAVTCGARVLSYGELDEEAGRLAARLRARGVGPEVPVAVLLDRSAELAVALLAVLRAGGAFVPVDPAYPPERREYLLSDSRARVVLTRAALAGTLPAGGPGVLCVDVGEVAAGPASPPRVGSDALAYLCYTSGSTGRPKAAMVSHRSLLCYAEAMRERMGLAPADRVLQFASPAFDVMIEEVFPAWLSGACVVFPEGEPPGSPRELLRLLEAQRVSVVELPTAFWHEWVRQVAGEGLRLPEGLRLVLMGGERVLPERLAQWAGLGVPLLHVFGLTETT